MIPNARLIAAALGGLVILGGCQAHHYTRDEARAKRMPVNCTYAEGDLRVLYSEKASTAQKAAAGAQAIVPAAAVMGLVTGDEGTNAEVATGEYNKVLDAKIAQIKTTCGIR